MENKMVQNYKNDVILSVEHLKTYFYQKRNQEPIRAVDDLSLIHIQMCIRDRSTGITITDSAGREVTLEKPLETVVTFNSSLYDTLVSFGAADTVIGVGDSIKKAIADGVPSVGARCV